MANQPLPLSFSDNGVNATQKKDRRYRLQFRFWLNAHNDDELALADALDGLKNGRAMHKTIRDGVRLILDLRAGRLDVLRELFPWATPAPDPDLHAKIDELTRLVETRHAPSMGAYQPRPTSDKSEVMPDDDTIQVRVATATADNNPTYNFMIASALQIYGNLDSLPDVIIDYALRTKRATTKQITRPYAQSGEGAKPGGPKKMDVPDLAQPDLDDLDDLL